MVDKKGQVSMTVIWMILAILGLAVVVSILVFSKNTGSSYLSKFYDCLRFGGSCWG